MAIPADLYKVELKGRWEYNPGGGPVVLFRWAMTWYVQSTAVTDNANRLIGYAEAFNRWYLGTMASPVTLAGGTVMDFKRCVRVASGMFGELAGDRTPAVPVAVRPVPAQAAMLVVGRTAQLGRQTRKWIPCIASSLLSVDRPDWGFTDPDSPLMTWSTDSLRPKTSGADTLTPVVWSESDEQLHPITEILLAPLPRTIRRRSLSEPFPLESTWP